MRRKSENIATVSRVEKRRRVEITEAASSAQVSQVDRPALVVLGVLCGLTLLVYLNSLWNGFVFDDIPQVVDHRLLRNLWNLPRILQDYRPLRDISYAMDYAIWGQRPVGFHLTNVLIHLVNTALVYWLILRFTGGTWTTAALAAAVFALHPIQGDSVTYVSGRRDVLFALLYLAAFHAYLSYDQRRGQRSWTSRRWLLLAIVCWLLGLMAKEMAVTLPILIFLWSLCRSYESGSGSGLKRIRSSATRALLQDRWLYACLAGMALIFGLWVITRGWSQRAGPGGFKYWGGSVYSNILTALHVHGWYLKQLILPTPIGQYSGGFDISTSLLDARVLISLLAIGILVFLGFAALAVDKLISFAILSYFALLLPVSQIVPHHELLADHNLYLPMMSFGLLAAVLIERISKRSFLLKRVAYGGARVAYGAAGAWIGILCVLTVVGNSKWKDEFSFWQANYNAVPNSVRAAYSLAGQTVSKNPRKAEDLLEKCISLDPLFAPAYTELVSIINSRQGAARAEELISTALSYPDSAFSDKERASPSDYRAQLTVAKALARDRQGDHDGARILLNQAIEIYPGNPQPYELLASYYHTKEPEKELEIRQKELTWCPGSAEAQIAVVNLLVKAERFDEAIPILNGMVSTDPADVFANYQLAQIYRTRMDCQRAWSYGLTARDAAIRAEDKSEVQTALRAIEKQCGARR
jgi:tetratricopeptide (TPR) repeat protein